MFTFVSGRTRSNDTHIVQIRVTDDDVYEESQQVIVGIVAVEPSSAGLIGDLHSTNLTLEDNNGPSKLTLYSGVCRDHCLYKYRCGDQVCEPRLHHSGR